MSTQMERMKQLIEEKKKKTAENTQSKRPDKNAITTRKGFNNKKTGGAFDK